VCEKINSGFIYRELLKAMSKYFQTGETPIPIEQSLEVMVFVQKALESAAKGGAEVSL